MTPALPLVDSNVTFIDHTRQCSKTPTRAIVLTVITVWLFLLGPAGYSKQPLLRRRATGCPNCAPLDLALAFT